MKTGVYSPLGDNWKARTSDYSQSWGCSHQAAGAVQDLSAAAIAFVVATMTSQRETPLRPEGPLV